MPVDQETVKKMKNADKLKRNATTKDQMVSALNKINYIRKKANESSIQERAPKPLNRSNHTHTVSIDGHGQHQVVAKSMAHAKKVAFKKAGISKLHGHPTMEPKTRILGELAMKRDPKQKNLIVPVKGKKGTSKYSRMKAMTKVKQENVVNETTDSIDELSPATHSSYQKKAETDIRRKWGQRDAGKGTSDSAYANQLKRKKGIAMSKSKSSIAKIKTEARLPKDDEEGAEHIVMQLRKSVSLRGNKDIMFQDGSSKKIAMRDAQRALDKYNRSKPMDKIKLQKQYEKDFRSFSQAIK